MVLALVLFAVSLPNSEYDEAWRACVITNASSLIGQGWNGRSARDAAFKQCAAEEARAYPGATVAMQASARAEVTAELLDVVTRYRKARR